MKVRRGGTVDEVGHLSEKIIEITSKVMEQNRSLFDLAYDINCCAHKLKYKCDVRNRDLQALTIMGLYFRVLDIYSSSIILCENDLGNESATVTRTGLEAVFFMSAIARNYDFAKDFIKSDQKDRLKFLNVASNPKSSLYELFERDSEDLKQLKIELKEEVENEKIIERKVEVAAQKAGLQEQYDYIYRILSQYSHPSPRSLENYFDFDENGIATGLVYPQKTSTVPLAMFTSISVILMAIKILNEQFQLDSSEIEEFEKRYKECDDDYKRKDKR